MVEIMVGIVKQEKDILVGHVTKNPSQNFCQQKTKRIQFKSVLLVSAAIP